MASSTIIVCLKLCHSRQKFSSKMLLTSFMLVEKRRAELSSDKKRRRPRSKGCIVSKEGRWASGHMPVFRRPNQPTREWRRRGGTPPLTGLPAWPLEQRPPFIGLFKDYLNVLKHTCPAFLLSNKQNFQAEHICKSIVLIFLGDLVSFISG